LRKYYKMSPDKIAIIGAGSWGTALAIHLGKLGHRVWLWVYEEELASLMVEKRVNEWYLPGFTLPDSVKPSHSIKEVLSSAEIVLSVTPSHVLREVYRNMLSYLSPEMIFVSATKGIENDTDMRMSEVISELVEERFNPRLAVLSGPSFALEVAKEHPTAVVVASADIELARLVQLGFSSPYFRIYTNSDIIGVEVGGSFKNIIAIAAGIIEGIGLGSNTAAALVTRGLAEMVRLILALGGRAETAYGLSGMGDLVLTCTGGLSRNRRLGIKLGQGLSLSQATAGSRMVAEGVKTTKSVYDVSRNIGIEMPITEQVYQILYNNKDPGDAIKELMGRELKEENG
jgi:glycerol-3-phosphate dehydrogenase (NAD(P)+)